MARRFLFGYNPGFGTFGAWMSKPGWDVMNPSDLSQFLLLPNFKHQQVVMSGVISVGPGGTVTIPYPANLGKKPYANFQLAQSSSNQYPHDINLTSNPPSTSAEVVGNMYIMNDRLTVTNSNSAGMNYNFVIYYRSVAP